jgi:anti-anti-sigma regulatory factor
MTEAIQELAIEGELSIYRAAELRQWLADVVPRGGALRIRLADVTEIDTAGAQLLLAGKRLAGERGCRLSYVDHGPPVLALLELFDLAAQLDDPIVLPAA